MSHPAPHRPWEKVGVDIFTFDDFDYLITVDYLSGWFELDRLGAKSVTNIVHCLRQHFARHGLPLEVISDNSPFASAEFRRFAKLYEFRHTTSSPRYSQSTGRVENAVKTAKRLMIKAKETNSDPFLALLEWRNTPSEQLGPSPAQLLVGAEPVHGYPPLTNCLIRLRLPLLTPPWRLRKLNRQCITIVGLSSDRHCQQATRCVSSLTIVPTGRKLK